MQSKSLFGLALALSLLAGCGTNQVAGVTPPATGNDATLAANENALGPDTAAPDTNYSVQQYMGAMRTNDGAMRLAIAEGMGDRMRMRFDNDDPRLHRLYPRLHYLFNRYPRYFHTVYPGIYTLRPTIPVVVLQSLFPDEDDLLRLLALERVFVVRNYNVYNPYFTPFIRPFVLRRHYPHRIYGRWGRW